MKKYKSTMNVIRKFLNNQTIEDDIKKIERVDDQIWIVKEI